MSLINFLKLEVVLAAHKLQLDLFGGAPGIRDQAGLESALLQPQASWGGSYLYQSVFDMAAVYAYHLAESQAFVDGNKRTALHAALLFLAINGYEIESDDSRLYDAMINIMLNIITISHYEKLRDNLINSTLD